MYFCPECKGSLTIAETIERWCTECRLNIHPASRMSDRPDLLEVGRNPGAKASKLKR